MPTTLNCCLCDGTDRVQTEGLSPEADELLRFRFQIRKDEVAAELLRAFGTPGRASTGRHCVGSMRGGAESKRGG